MLTFALGAGVAGGALPATAQARTVTLKLGSGLTLSLPLPDGTPFNQLQLPPLSSPIVGVTMSPATTAPTAGPLPPLPGAAAISTPTTLPAGPVPVIAPVLDALAPQALTGAAKVAQAAVAGAGAAKRAAVRPEATQFRTSNGLPTIANPTLSLTPIGPVPIGVPNFFIDSYHIPPFLVPIYQAAGVQYDVPWQILAAINEIETDYGRNLSVSSAGAIGWMQFLPETWKQYGVDGNGDGVKDPYNPVDAIFGAARFLHAAGASQNLRGAIFAYNNANWYVDSVMLRAKLIGGLPADLVSSITGMTDGLFPVHAATRYADDVSETAAQIRKARAQNAPVPLTASAKDSTINIYAKAGSPAIAVHDGLVVGLGFSTKLGNFVKLRDAYGNTYTYSQLKQLADLYAVLKPSAQKTRPLAAEAKLQADQTPQAPASAGHQATTAPAVAGSLNGLTLGTRPATDTPAGPARLFAHPKRHASFVAGGKQQVTGAGPVDFSNYLVGTFGLHPSDITLRPLKTGARVIAGTILGRLGSTHPFQASHLGFQIRPSGKGAPLIDPKPILDGWKLLESTAVYRAADLSSVLGPADSPTIGAVLLESKSQLQQQVLADPSIDIYPCGRTDIEAGLIDQRILAMVEFLAKSGIKPTVSALRCGNSLANTAFDKSGKLSDSASGDGVDISAINGIPVEGHQGPGSITDIAIRQLLKLQGSYKPNTIVSLMSYPSTDNTVAASDHADRIHIGFATLYDPHSKFGAQVNAVLKPDQWLRLITRLGQIANPSVATQPSSSSIPVPSGG